MKKILLLLFAFSFVRPAQGQKNEISLVLNKALFHNNTFRAIQLDFKENNGVWDNLVMGYANFYGPNGRYSTQLASLNKSDHYGSLTSLLVNGNNFTVSVRMVVNSDPFVAGGLGVFTLQLVQNGDSLNGTFTGTYRDSIPVSGTVKGTRKLSPLKAIPGYVKPERGEHPRTIFRKKDIDSIRWKAANTPEGQAMVAQLDAALARPFTYVSRTPAWMAAGNAFKFILTNDPYWANETRRIVTNTMNTSAQTTKMISLAPRYMGIAQAYDMCYDYWQATDPAFREKVGHWLEERMLDIVKGGGEGYNSHPMSNWMCIAYGSLGTMAMALAGDSVRFVYEEPLAPFMGNVPPVTGFSPGSGVVPTQLVPDSMPHNWIYAGPFKKNRDSDDCLQSGGGSDSLFPGVGTTVFYDTATESFRTLSSNYLWRDNNFTGGKFYIDAVNSIQHAYFNTAYYFTVLNNISPGYKRINLIRFGAVELVAWLAGKKLRNGDLVFLEAGTYPVMLEATIGLTEPWGKIAFRMTFTNKTSAEAGYEYAANQANFQKQWQEWNAGYNEYLASNRSAYTAARNLRIAEQGMKRWFQMGLGNKGFYTEGDGYLRFALTCGGAQFIHAYPQVMGADFGEGYDAYRILPKLMYENVGSKMWEWGPAGWGTFGLQEERSGCMDMLFNNLYAAEKPAFKWMYDKEVGLSGNQSFDIFMPQQAAYALKNYPFGMVSSHPSTICPKHSYDTQKGYFIGRNGWNYTRDLVTTWYLKPEFCMGTHQASDDPEIRIQGFGRQVARILQTTVSQPTNNEQGGKVRSYEADTAGSFIVSATLNDDYKAPFASNVYPDQGIRALRSFANDFSGKSGAPGLYAVVDRFKGGSNHSFKMILNGASGLVTSSSGFVASFPNNVRLTGKILVPASPTITYTAGNLAVTGDSTFFIVLSLTEGAGPEMLVSGAGINAVVQAGGQSVWFADSVLHLQEINTVPVVKIAQPLPNRIFNTAAIVQISAEASDNDGVKKVAFYRNDVLFSEDTTAPFTSQVSNLPVGMHVLKAKAWDNKGAWNVSTPVPFTVVPDTPPPAVGLLTGQLIANNYVSLSWTDSTDSEENFLLERKTGSGEYVNLATLPANTSHFLDVNTCTNCTLSYRLRTANANGMSDPSNVVVIQVVTGIKTKESSANDLARVYPNPFSNQLNVQWNSIRPDFLTLDVYNLTGKWMMQQNFGFVPSGSHERTILLSGMPSGLVFGIIKGSDGKPVAVWKGKKE